MSTTPPAPYQPYAQATVDPGKNLNIAAIVCAFLLPLLGLIFGIMGRSKSRQAGFDGKLGLVAIIVSVSWWALSLLLMVVMTMSSGS